MGRILHRPTVLPAFGFALRLALGEFANEGVLVGQRAVPAVLETAGFASVIRHCPPP
jgi:NAD dependent epimerase/dehydratase family enzyme